MAGRQPASPPFPPLSTFPYLSSSPALQLRSGADPFSVPAGAWTISPAGAWAARPPYAAGAGAAGAAAAAEVAVDLLRPP